MQKLLDWNDIWYSKVFGIADYESELKIKKLKMADRIWRTKMQKVTWLGRNLVLECFWGHWLGIRTLHLEIQNGGPNLVG